MRLELKKNLFKLEERNYVFKKYKPNIHIEDNFKKGKIRMKMNIIEMATFGYYLD